MPALPEPTSASPDEQPPAPDPTSETSADTAPEAAEPAPEPLPLLILRDGLPEVTDTDAALAGVVAAVAGGTGPVAIDAERASGYRYSSRAYLIQLRREGAGSALVDPTAFDDLAALDEAIGGAEWILHAATQDLACLREVGLRPRALFDTELAARLLGYPRVGLATLVEQIVGRRMRKEHSAVDWSIRPLPEPWLDYAALDVEVLLELREALRAELVAADKLGWAEEEFTHLLDFAPAPRTDPWRRTSGIHKAKGRRALAAVRELWVTRDEIAQERDTTPGRLLPDRALVAAANAMPTSTRALLDTPGFHGRAARRNASDWHAALVRARTMDERDLPPVTVRTDAPPPPRTWADRDPEAAARLVLARDLVSAYAEEHRVPLENLLTPDYLRRVLWRPPRVEEPELPDAVAAALRDLGAREWQIAITAPMIISAIVQARAEAQ